MVFIFVDYNKEENYEKSQAKGNKTDYSFQAIENFGHFWKYSQ